MKEGERVLKNIRPLLEEAYGPEQARAVLEQARGELDRLCREHAADPKALKPHTEGNIFPCFSLFTALQAQGVPRADAAAFLDRSWSAMAEPKAESIRKMLKLPGLYRLMPAIFRWVTVHQFGEAAGFAATFYRTPSTRVKFDMTRCPYCSICRELGCPELTVCFCHTDDVTDGSMHPRLKWNRTKTMGDGGDVCDFDLFVTDGK